MTDRLDQPLIEELARVVIDPGLARLIAQNAGFPGHQIPHFNMPVTYWGAVVHGARSGAIAIDDGVRALAKAAARQFPRNTVFLAYSTGDEVTTWRIRIDIHRASIVDKDNIVQALKSVTGDLTIKMTKSYDGSLVLVLQMQRRTSVYLEWLFANEELSKLGRDERCYRVIAVGELEAVAAVAAAAAIPPRIRFGAGLGAASAGVLVLVALLAEPSQNSEFSKEGEDSGDYSTSSTTGFEPAPLDVPQLNTSTEDTAEPDGSDGPETPGPPIPPGPRCPPNPEQLEMNVTHKSGSHYATVDIKPKRRRLKYVVQIEVDGRFFSEVVPGGRGSVKLGGADNIGTFTLTGTASGGKCPISNSEPHEITLSPEWSCKPDPSIEGYAIDTPEGRVQCQQHLKSNSGLVNRSGDTFIIPDAEEPIRCICHRS